MINHQNGLVVLFSLASVMANVDHLLAAVRVQRLAGAYAQFDREPETGDLAGVLADGSAVHRLRIGNGGQPLTPEVLRQGPGLQGVAYGRYQGRVRVFSAAGTKSLVILDPSGKAEEEPLDLPGLEVHSLHTSMSPDDPWVFCSVGPALNQGKNGTALLAVNLNSDATHEVLENSKDSEVSADGKLVYVRGMLPSDGRRVFQRITEFSHPIQECLELKTSQPRGEALPYVVAPFGGVTLCGSALYDDELNALLIKLPTDLTSPCFLRSRSALVGLAFRPVSGPRGSIPPALVIKAFDTNAMTPSGDDVVVSVFRDYAEFSDSATRAKTIFQGSKVISDEDRDRVICITNDQFITIGFDELTVPKTSHLGARFRGASPGDRWSQIPLEPFRGAIGRHDHVPPTARRRSCRRLGDHMDTISETVRTSVSGSRIAARSRTNDSET